MFSDDTLLEKLVLKGGNALSLVYHLGGRTSIDLDLSIDGDFDDLPETKKRLFNALKSTFDSAGYVVFEEKFSCKPEVVKEGADSKWGGYQIKFKVIGKENFNKWKENPEAIRRNALTVSPTQTPVFCIDFSKYEYCADKQPHEFNHFTIYAYTLPMIALEKIRAVCQQLPDYTLRGYRTPRARDFYDIVIIMRKNPEMNLLSPENVILLRKIFEAKNVSRELLLKIRDSREFHKADWNSVVASAPKLEPPDFDFYFNQIIDLAEKLHSLWVE